jgi:hypothetical protein
VKARATLLSLNMEKRSHPRIARSERTAQQGDDTCFNKAAAIASAPISCAINLSSIVFTR